MWSSSLAQNFVSLFRFLVTFCSFQMIKTFVTFSLDKICCTLLLRGAVHILLNIIESDQYNIVGNCPRASSPRNWFKPTTPIWTNSIQPLRITRNLYLTFPSMYYLSLDVESWICGSPGIAGESQSSVSYSGHDGSWQTGMSCLKTFLFWWSESILIFFQCFMTFPLYVMSWRRLFVISFPV